MKGNVVAPDIRAAVAMPWRPQPDRIKAFEYVKAWWEGNGFVEDKSLFIGEEPSTTDLPFSLAEARNAMVSKAGHADVVIVADADTVPEIGLIREAIELSMTPRTVVYPFTGYRYLDSRYLDSASCPGFEHLFGPQGCLNTLMPKWTMQDSVGGIMVTSVLTYWEFGGMDEKFERCWGFEDVAFLTVAKALGTVRRLPGSVYSFSHDVEGIGRDWSDENPNYWRAELYRMAQDNPKLIRELIKK